MEDKSKIEKKKEAFWNFMIKMVDVRKRQLALFDEIDKIVSKEKADEIRKKININ